MKLNTDTDADLIKKVSAIIFGGLLIIQVGIMLYNSFHGVLPKPYHFLLVTLWSALFCMCMFLLKNENIFNGLILGALVGSFLYTSIAYLAGMF